MFPALFAFGWIDLPMLGWLAAAAAPIVIHLWSRRKYRKTNWAAMQFLLAAVERQSRRIALTEWLLLAVRVAIIALVALAAAQPYFDRPAAATVATGRTHRILVLDGSFSMAYRVTDKTRFDLAKDAARQIIQHCGRGDVVSVALMTSSPHVVVEAADPRASRVVDELERMRQPQTTTDISATFAMLRQLVADVGRNRPEIARHDVIFLTDLQRVAWSPNLDAAAKTQLRREAKELSRVANLFVIDLGRRDAENCAVVDLQPVESLLTVGGDAAFTASLRWFGGRAPSRQKVEWFVDGRRTTESTVAFSSDGRAAASMTCRFDSPGDHRIEIRAPGDRLDLDNHRYLSATVRTAVRVLCIDGRPSSKPFGGAADFLAAALNAGGRPEARNPVKAEIAAEDAILERRLAAYDAVFFCDVPQFTASEARAVDAYLQGGGNVAFFLGDQTAAARYNVELGVAGEKDGDSAASQKKTAGSDMPEAAARLAMLPAEIGGVVDEPQSRIDPLGFRHPLVKALRGQGENSLRTTPVFKHFRLRIPKDGRTCVALSLGNGDPLLVEREVGRGRALLAATSLDPSWTALPVWPSFVPLVREMAAWCAGAELQRRNILVGDSIETLFSMSDSAAAPSVVCPDGVRETMQRTASGHAVRLAAATQSGFYTLDIGRAASGRDVFAVNVDPAESDLAAISAEELCRRVLPDVPFACRTAWQDCVDSPGLSSLRAAFPVDLLEAALVLLLFECVLAWRLDGGRR